MRGLSVDPAVFFISAALIVLFVGAGALFTDSLADIATAVQNFIVSRFGWLYILVVGAFPALAIYLMCSRFGSVRLGKDTDRPKYSTFAWLSMLYGAGLGIGLVFYGVAEPMMHYATPPLGTGGTPERQNRRFFSPCSTGAFTLGRSTSCWASRWPMARSARACL
jgi:choline/glycine/proline betaine transport protein